MLRCSVTYLKLLQIEDTSKQACIFLLLRCSVTYSKLLQIEGTSKQACIFLLLRCSVTYSKLLQIEGTSKQACIFLLLRQRNLFKVTANRRQYKTSKLVFVLLRGDVIALVTFKGAEINDFSLFDEKSKQKIWRYKLKNVTLHPLIKQSETVIHCDCKTTSIAFPLLERWQSGRMHRS